MNKERYISYTKIVDHIDIGDGDIVLVASDIFGLAVQSKRNKEEFDANKFIDSIKKK